MTFLRQIGEAYAGWMDGVAAAATALLGRLTAPPKVRLIEQAAGVFALQPARGGAQAMPLTIANGIAACSPEAAAKVSGSRVELALRPDRFFFRPLEAPKREEGQKASAVEYIFEPSPEAITSAWYVASKCALSRDSGLTRRQRTPMNAPPLKP